MNKLQEKLSAGLVIFDGAMGTEIYRRNFFVNASYEELSLSRPQVVEEISQAYLDAGAMVLTTNTFNANSRRLGKFGLAGRMAEINRAGVAIARKVANGKALVAGSIGPAGEAESEDDKRSAGELLSEQMAELAGADFVIFESIRSAGDLDAALTAAAEHPEIPYITSFVVDTHLPEEPQKILQGFFDQINLRAAEHLPTAVGLNCGGGPESTLVALEVLVGLTELPVVVQPNAGAPRVIDGRMLYLTSGEYFSTYARRYAQMGAAAIGGCCGITPAHIAEMARTVKPVTDSERRILPELSVKDNEIELPPPLPLAERSSLGAKLANGEFITEIELTPPRGYDLSKAIAAARRCKEAGIDALNLPDGPRASARITPLVTAIAIERETGMVTVPHCCCRDRSLIGLQAELLGYAGAGIHNLLFITGDPPKLGDYPFSSGVFDTDSIGLVKLQNRMNRGIDLGGEKLNAPTGVVIGVGADPSAIDIDRECRRLEEKVAAGADFVVTQPVFDAGIFLSFLDRISHLNIPVIAGLWPLVSMRNAEFMRTEVPGVVVPDAVMERMRNAGDDRDSQRETGIAIAMELAEKLRASVQGFQVSAPFGNVEIALKVLGR